MDSLVFQLKDYDFQRPIVCFSRQNPCNYVDRYGICNHINICFKGGIWWRYSVYVPTIIEKKKSIFIYLETSFTTNPYETFWFCNMYVMKEYFLLKTRRDWHFIHCRRNWWLRRSTSNLDRQCQCGIWKQRRNGSAQNPTTKRVSCCCKQRIKCEHKLIACFHRSDDVRGYKLHGS